MTFRASDLLDLTQTAHAALFANLENAWEVLPLLAAYLARERPPNNFGTMLGTVYVGPDVAIGAGTVIENGATIKGPAWIGENCQIRSGCYIRENVIVGNDVVLGNSCEFKNCLIFNGAQIPHFSYVGDSVLGFRAHLAAGVILSNMRLDQQPVTVSRPDGKIATGLRKFGAIIGDQAEIGCNAVLSPGSIIGRRSLIYPGVQWRGFLPAEKIAQLRQDLTIVQRTL